MTKKDYSSQSTPRLPEEIRNLIARKVRHLRREQDIRWGELKRATYAKLRDKLVKEFIALRVRHYHVFSGAVYKEIVANAVVITQEWPGMVWGAIASTLDNAQIALVDGQELESIVDEYVWEIGDAPFTLKYIDLQKYKESVQREASRYGLNASHPTSDRYLSLEVVAGQCSIKNTGRRERDLVSIAIAEYVISHSQIISPKTPPSFDSIIIRREARKLDTQDMYENWRKKYRELKKENSGSTDSSIAIKISKMSIGQGKSTGTIRKNMKTREN
ncbi:MAG: hypothetical protein KJ950_00055 [Proteobacteria bacterium]|nr:hypothetical protein [Pseudomonadota bacterium]MBU1688694.1 hypothetical protein [Pseudomonadota bacterium]